MLFNVTALTLTMTALLPTAIHAEPTVIVNTADGTNTRGNESVRPNTTPSDSQSNPINTPINTPTNTPINSTIHTPTGSINPTLDIATQLAQNNVNSVAVDMVPSDTALSQANQKLLTDNARLQRELNDMDTRVDLLTYERSGQLFMYGVSTAVGSSLFGIFLGWLIFGRRDRW